MNIPSDFETKYGMSRSLSRLLSDAMNIYSVLVTFRVSLFALSHMRIFSRSVLAPDAISFIDFPVVVIFVSSAYIRAVECCRQEGRSLM